MKKIQNTSWQKVGGWYNKTVGEEGHYYHQHVILPNVLRLLKAATGDRLLDLGCGQGILARQIATGVEYLGIDLATNLIEEAKRLDSNPKHKYLVADISGNMPIKEKFNRIALILVLQNVKSAFKVLKNASNLVSDKGEIVIVLNHPAFRIPKQSDWGIDKENEVQYRKIFNYMTPLEIAIKESPFNNRTTQESWSFHYPLSAYSEMLFDNGLVIEKIEEWISDKISTGRAAKMENKARNEFPMFMAIVARKLI